MGGSRRSYKKSRHKVRVGLPKKKPNIFKPAFSIPPKLKSLIPQEEVQWDSAGTVLNNYRSYGVVSNPNLLGVQSRSLHMVECEALQLPPPTDERAAVSEFDPIDSGSDLEDDDLKSVLGKKRRDGKTAPSKPLTAMQRVYMGRLIEKYGDNYECMFKDMKLNAMQHPVAALRKLCKRFYIEVPQSALSLGMEST